jgi:metal-responsive CopG/Arc/MetJ family transcriptional regulator
LTDAAASATSPRMGRPSLDVTPTVVRLSKAVLARIDAIMDGKSRRAVFIREAVERELARRERAAKREG